jgi:hypothetical protein
LRRISLSEVPAASAAKDRSEKAIQQTAEIATIMRRVGLFMALFDASSVSRASADDLSRFDPV